MHVDVQRVSQELLRHGTAGGEERSASIRARVMAARSVAMARTGRPNAWLNPQQLKRVCQVSDEGHRLLEMAIDKLGLSHRAYHRILKLARTIADLGSSEHISPAHVSEAIGYRRLDRQSPAAR
jgi:magnesium chelatase family protein